MYSLESMNDRYLFGDVHVRGEYAVCISPATYRDGI